MDTKVPSSREACKLAALALLATHDDLWRLEPWTSTRLPAEAKRTLNAVIADWVERNEPPLEVHERLAAMIRAEPPEIGETRYQIRLAMAHHLRDRWTRTAIAAEVAGEPAAAPSAPPAAPRTGGLDVEALVRQALEETESEPGDGLGDAPLPEPPPAHEHAPASDDRAWECGLCGTPFGEQDALVEHVATCGIAPEDPEPEPVGDEAPMDADLEQRFNPADDEDTAPEIAPADDADGRFQCALCGMVTEGAAVLEDHLSRCQGAERSPRAPRRLAAVPKPAKRSKARGRK
jgi:hypothetical protein